MLPANVSGESKLLVERMLAWHHRVHGLSVACLRYFNAAGASADRGERHDPETHLIPIMLPIALGHRDRLDVFGDDYPTRDGTAVRDYVRVADLADAHVRALESLDEHTWLTLNLGGEGFGVFEVVDAVRHMTGHPIPVRVAPRRAGGPATLVASHEHARDTLGWVPKQHDPAQPPSTKLRADPWPMATYRRRCGSY